MHRFYPQHLIKKLQNYSDNGPDPTTAVLRAQCFIQINQILKV